MVTLSSVRSPVVEPRSVMRTWWVPVPPAVSSAVLNRWTTQTPSTPGSSAVSVPGGAVSAAVNAIVAGALADAADITSRGWLFSTPPTIGCDDGEDAVLIRRSLNEAGIGIGVRGGVADAGDFRERAPGRATFYAEVGRSRGNIVPTKVDLVDAHRSGDQVLRGCGKNRGLGFVRVVEV